MIWFRIYFQDKVKEKRPLNFHAQYSEPLCLQKNASRFCLQLLIQP